MAPDDDMKRGLFSASRRPKRLCDVENFKTLHSPRVHGMTEWLLQYENACRRQEVYLQQLKELRQQFQSKQHNRKNNISKSDPITTDIQGVFWQSGVPLSRLNKRFPNKDNVQHHKKQLKLIIGDPREFADVHEFPKAGTEFLVTPKNIHATVNSLRSDKSTVAVPPLDDADSKTDYEPIEIIAKRNKLNVRKYFEVISR